MKSTLINKNKLRKQLQKLDRKLHYFDQKRNISFYKVAYPNKYNLWLKWDLERKEVRAKLKEFIG